LNVYQEVAKSWQQRTMPMEYHPDPEGIDVYRRWCELNPDKN